MGELKDLVGTGYAPPTTQRQATTSTHVHQPHAPNFLLEGCRCCSDKEVGLNGTYLTYFPFRAMIESRR